MKITQINFSIGQRFGGAPLVVSTLVKGILKRGHEINLICHRIDDDYLQNNKNVHIELLPEGIFKSLKGLKGTLCDLDTDIIHVHSYNSLNPFITELAIRNNNIPLIFTPYYHPFGNHPKILRKMFNITFGIYSFKHADKIIVQTPYEKKMLKDRISSNKIEILPNPFELKKKEIGEKEITQFKRRWNLGSKNILFVGRLSKNKGIDILLRAFKEVRRKYNHISLLIVGKDDNMYRPLNNLKERLDLDQVVFTGMLSEKDICIYRLKTIPKFS